MKGWLKTIYRWLVSAGMKEPSTEHECCTYGSFFDTTVNDICLSFRWNKTWYLERGYLLTYHTDTLSPACQLPFVSMATHRHCNHWAYHCIQFPLSYVLDSRYMHLPRESEGGEGCVGEGGEEGIEEKVVKNVTYSERLEWVKEEEERKRILLVL